MELAFNNNKLLAASDEYIWINPDAHVRGALNLPWPLASAAAVPCSQSEAPALLNAAGRHAAQTNASRHIKTNCSKTINWENYEFKVLVSSFKRYLHDHEYMRLFIKGKNIETGQSQSFYRRNIHRWTDSYLNRRLARLYKLRDWKKQHPELPENMWTFTVPHNENKWGRKVRSGANHYEAWENLKQGFDRLRHCEVMKDRDYVLMYEPHESGYPHIHTLFFNNFTEQEQIHIKELWHEFTGADITAGADYAPDRNINHLIAYLVKYMVKTFHKNVNTWSYGEWIFNAIAHYKKYRLFSASNSLSEIMRLDNEHAGKFQCEQVLMDGNRDKNSTQLYTVKLWALPDPVTDEPQILPFADRLERWKYEHNWYDSRKNSKNLVKT